MFSAEQTNPHTHSARFQATEIRMSVKTRLVTDSSEVSATSGEPETVGRCYMQGRMQKIAEGSSNRRTGKSRPSSARKHAVTKSRVPLITTNAFKHPHAVREHDKERARAANGACWRT